MEKSPGVTPTFSTGMPDSEFWLCLPFQIPAEVLPWEAASDGLSSLVLALLVGDLALVDGSCFSWGPILAVVDTGSEPTHERSLSVHLSGFQ